jgi:hypothetical protein
MRELARGEIVQQGDEFFDEDDGQWKPTPCEWWNEPLSEGDYARRNTLHLRLTLDVEYFPHGVAVGELKDNLYGLVQRGMGDGLLTGESTAEVDTHSAQVEEITK